MNSNNSQKRSLLAAQQLSFAYNKQTQLKDINLDFCSGEFVGLIGPNGAGKTTLMQLLLGLLPAQQGQVSVNGHAINKVKRKDIAKQIAFVPQSTELPFSFTVQEVVMMGRNPYLGPFQLASHSDLQIVTQAMQTADINHLSTRRVNQLSGGERQRVIIARALAQQTQSILLDEPIASLDISHQFETLNLIKALTEQGKLAITAIHDLNLAARYCSRLILIGKKTHNAITVIADGSPEQVLNKANLAQHFSIEAQISQVAKQTNAVQLNNIKPIARQDVTRN